MKSPGTVQSQFSLVLAFLLPLGLLVGTGCRSSKLPASASFASVVIANRTVAEIQRASAAVFLEAGYFDGLTSNGEMTFEKEGTRGNQIAHGGWQANGQVHVRVRAQIVPLPDGTHRLQCKAYMVNDPGDIWFEEEKRLANFRSAPYQKLLNQVAERLK